MLATSSNDEDKSNTTFSSHYETYRYGFMPSGLRNLSATILDALDIIQPQVRRKSWLVFTDVPVKWLSPARRQNRWDFDTTALSEGASGATQASLFLKKYLLFWPLI